MATPATAANTIATILPFLSSLVNVIATETKTTPAVAVQIQTALSGVQQGVQALAISETAVESKPIVARIAADAQAVLAVASSFPLPPPFNIILMIVSSLLPTVISAVELLMANHVTVAA